MHSNYTSINKGSAIQNDRIHINEYIDQLGQISSGGYGQVFLGINNFSNEYVAIKRNNKQDVHQQEYKIMKRLKKQQFKGFPVLLEKEISNKDGNILIMNLLGKSLKEIMKEQKKLFSLKTVCQIAIDMINKLEMLHSTGFIHLDIKPENILLGDNDYTSIESHQLYLIDFGVSVQYLNNDGSHIQNVYKECFKGNILFSSKNAFQLLEQSRRDDIISLIYLTIFLYSGQLNWINNINVSDNSQIKQVISLKNNLTPEEICSGRKSIFLEVLKYAYQLNYDEQPNYGQLRHMFLTLLLNKNIIPDKNYDWHINISNKISQYSTQLISKNQQTPSKLMKFSDNSSDEISNISIDSPKKCQNFEKQDYKFLNFISEKNESPNKKQIKETYQKLKIFMVDNIEKYQILSSRLKVIEDIQPFENASEQSQYYDCKESLYQTLVDKQK